MIIDYKERYFELYRQLEKETKDHFKTKKKYNELVDKYNDLLDNMGK